MKAEHDTGYPIVNKPGKSRIEESIFKQNPSLPRHQGLVSGGLYPWLSEKALKANGRERVKQVGLEIKQKQDSELEKLEKLLKPHYQTFDDKLSVFKKQLVDKELLGNSSQQS